MSSNDSPAKEKRTVQIIIRRSSLKSLDPYVEAVGERADDVIDRLVAHMKSCPYRPRRPRPSKQVRVLSVPQDNIAEEKPGVIPYDQPPF